jgi:hypothetical protein
VNEVGRELSQAPLETAPQPQKGKVKPKVRINADGERTPLWFHDPKWSSFAESFLLSKADAEKRISVSVCECGQFPAGARGAVHFVERIRQKSDAWNPTLLLWKC